ncbi:MAG: molybdopterin-dependent oxidoreductase [Methanotrichaceae archaeon]|nr:molybdopterin-dependent oxidoreductase [Methanotrichaceae archaeon]
MVFSNLHWVPSFLAALLTFALAFNAYGKPHRDLSVATILLALVGLFGYVSAGSFRFFPIDFHTLHAWAGLFTLTLLIILFVDKIKIHKIKATKHCSLGKLVALLAGITLVMGLMMLFGLVPTESIALSASNSIQEATSSHLAEVEAAEYQGVKLMPLSAQGNNAIKGTQRIDRETYRLKVTGLTERELNLSYSQILELPAYSELVYMPCVEGWGFNAKWTGFRVTDLLNITGLKPEANYVLFTSVDGYSTSLLLDYLRKDNILLAYGINDVTLPQDRGFPLQLVAKDKYGYKWAKWITRIEVTDKDTKGYWEARGYSNSANVGQSPFALSWP